LEKDAMARTGRSRRLGLEALEPRTLLSGNVTAVVTGGNLVITGDALDNHIAIDQAGLNPGEFRVDTGGNVTTINGTPGAKVVTGVTKDVRITFGDGNDAVTFNNAALPRHLNVNGGEGDDGAYVINTQVRANTVLTLGDGNNAAELTSGTTLGGSLRIIGGGGDDGVTLIDMGVAGATSIDLKDGVNGVTATTGIRPSNTFQGNLAILAGDSYDYVSLQNTTVARKTTIRVGDGDSMVTLDGFASGGKVDVTGGSGYETVTFEDVRIANSANVDLKGGTGNAFHIETDSHPASYISGNLVVRGTDGDDLVTVGDTRVDGGAKFLLGSGNNTVEVDPTMVGGKLTIACLTGDDIVDLADVLIGSGVAANLGDGTNAFTLRNAAIPYSNVGGSLTVATGVGDDTLTVENAVVDGKLNVNLSDGTNTLNFTDSFVHGDVTISTGRHDEMLEFGTLDISGKTVLKCGDGTNIVSFGQAGQGVRVARGLDIRGGSGRDAIGIEEGTIGGSVSVVLGQGQNNFAVFTGDVGGSLRYQGGSGVDNTHYRDFNIGRGFVANVGDGWNQVIMESPTIPVSTVLGGVTVLGGNGEDITRLNDTEVGRNVRYVLKNGSNDCRMIGSSIQGKLTVTGGADDDNVQVFNSRVLRGANVTAGSDSNLFEMVNSAVGAALTYRGGRDVDWVGTSNSEIVGPTRLSTDTGDDWVVVDMGSTFHGLLDIRSGDGKDTIKINTALVAGRLFVDAGGDDDTMTIAQVGSGPAIFEGPAVIRMGDREDNLTIGVTSDSTHSAHFLAPVTLDGGPRGDVLNRGTSQPDGNGNTFFSLNQINWELVT
jgi:hypothetical protein